ncbi:TPA: ParA family protein [Pseudomonas aeruginosa]|nr:ParA family protein [Pseudomonas aeruginosa]HBO5255425.1 ParA family protein [Pseudomonas aeruginosa]HBO5326390.1 ParA family protein [Pseudomonas aeruginosa]HCF6782650.1 ParA family protein [Pseudomonas aeruginosa]HEJ5600960.1 ParA family protein [Pseudomonas aeruginosa]
MPRTRSSVASKKPKSICFFNNKGGVGKTTLVANLAAELTLNHSKKVLVIDADPQCNLTQYVLTDEEFIDTYSNKDPSTIFSVIHPLSTGRGYTTDLPISKTQNFGFDVIIGDPRLALKEDLLAQDWREAKAGGIRGLRTTLVFHNVIEQASGYDYIFFDMGPSLGAINRAILLAVDCFLVPMSIDIFSSWALKNIGEAVKVWEKDLEFGMRNSEDPSELPSVTIKKLRFLGYVTQQHKERKEKENTRIVEAYNNISKKLPEIVNKNLSSFYPSTLNPHIGEIKHLASLAPKSQTLHQPMINVTAVGSYASMRKQAREIYSTLAKRFMENVRKIDKEAMEKP